MNVSPVGGAFNKTPEAAPPKNPRLEKATKDFEGIWLAQILREARPKGGMFGKSFAAETFQDMMSQALGQQMATSGQLGFAKMLYKHLAPHAAAEANAQVASPQPMHETGKKDEEHNVANLEASDPGL